MFTQFASLNTRSNRIAICVALLFAIVFRRHSARVAALFIGGASIGYFMEFHLFRVLICLGGRRRPTRVEIFLGALGLIGSVALVYCGFATLLLMFIAISFIIDALVLRFA